MELKELNVEYDFIAIIDCLSSVERDDSEISQTLILELRKEGIVCKEKYCDDKNDLLSFFKKLENYARTGDKFLIHFVSHGNAKCIGFKSTNEPITWGELSKLLIPINKSMNNELLINMTTCYGLHGIKINETVEEYYPFFGLVGCPEGLKKEIAKVINKLFYSKIINGSKINVAVQEVESEIRQEYGIAKSIQCISSQGFNIIDDELNRNK